MMGFGESRLQAYLGRLTDAYTAIEKSHSNVVATQLSVVRCETSSLCCHCNSHQCRTRASGASVSATLQGGARRAACRASGFFFAAPEMQANGCRAVRSLRLQARRSRSRHGGFLEVTAEHK